MYHRDDQGKGNYRNKDDTMGAVTKIATGISIAWVTQFIAWFATFLMCVILKASGTIDIDFKNSWLGDWSLYGVALPLSVPVLGLLGYIVYLIARSV